MDMRKLSKSKESINESGKFIKSNKNLAAPKTAIDRMTPANKPTTLMTEHRLSQDSIVLPNYLRTIGTGSSNHDF